MSRETVDARVARLETLGDALLRDIQRLQEQHKDDIARVDRDVETFAPLAGQLIEFIAEVRSLGDDVSDLKTDLKERAGMSVTLKAALIVAGGGVVVAIIAALSGGHP